MKRNYLMMAMAAAMLASCAQTGLVEEIAEEPQKAIGFSTFVDKATRAENSEEEYSQEMNIHHNVFSVWGFKNTSTTAAVFAGVNVEYVAASTNGDGSTIPAHWKYDELRYWDKAATDYYFYACAPITAPFIFTGTQDNGKFTIGTTGSEYEVDALNISPKNSEEAQTSWKEKTEKDLMIAAPCHLNGTSLSNAYASKVGLNFIHILSRLNIVINKYVNSSTSILVKNITIGNMKYKGTFDEETGVADNTIGTNSRWTKTTDKKDYSYDIDYSVHRTQNNYVIEALIMPQTTKTEEVKLDGTGDMDEAYIRINYSLTSGSTTEYFTACYNLAKVFGIESGELEFNEGWQNTLTISLSPAAIVFTANTAPWDDKVTKELPIK
ncbi:MAG: fimbrillin family protein [Bacteroidaceae bacterium]|nr:fimbrillin family protein [Bacteroidaceae bacterium]